MPCLYSDVSAGRVRQSAYQIGEEGQKLMTLAKKGLVKKRETITTFRLSDQKAACSFSLEAWANLLTHKDSDTLWASK